jgi:hypothetical protein
MTVRSGDGHEIGIPADLTLCLTLRPFLHLGQILPAHHQQRRNGRLISYGVQETFS